MCILDGGSSETVGSSGAEHLLLIAVSDAAHDGAVEGKKWAKHN